MRDKTSKTYPDIRYALILLISLAVIVFDLDAFSFKTPVGRITFFEIFTVIFIFTSVFLGKIYHQYTLLILFYFLIVLVVIYQLITGLCLEKIISSNVGLNFQIKSVFEVSMKYILYSTFMFLFSHYLIETRNIERLCKFIVKTTVLVAVVGFLQVLAINGISPFKDYFLWENIRGGGHRIASTFRWQGIFIFYLLMFVPIYLGQVIDLYYVGKTDIKKNILIFSLLVLSLFSGSRTSLLLFVNVFIMLLFSIVRENKKRGVSFSFFSKTMFFLMIIFIFKENIMNSRAVRRVLGLEGAVGVTTGPSPRKRIFTSSIELWKNSPLIGVGTGNLQNYIGKTSHNSYLEFLVENGFIGFLLFLSLIIILLFLGIHNFKKSIESKYYLYLGIGLSIFNVLIYQLTASAFQYRLTWFYLALVFACYFEDQKGKELSRRVL